MASIILGQAASVVGGAIGSSVGAAIGYGVGSCIGSHIDSQLFGKNIHSKTVGARLADLTIQTSSYGKMIPIVYGTSRIAGNVIWSLPIAEHEANYSEEIGGKGGGSRHEATHTNYYYTITLAIALCEGPIEGILRAWADASSLNLAYGKYRLYKGDEEQLPDPLIESYQGIGRTPAYRGIAYIVIEDFPLGNYGNRIPNFTFEVKRSVLSRSTKNPPLEDLIKSMVMIPGSGEFVYDTTIQTKLVGDQTQSGKFIPLGKQYKINQNNPEYKADAVLALDQLQNTCKNLEWVAPVITWFGDHTEIEKCNIRPGVEHKDGFTTSPDIWQVAHYSRKNAYLISRDQYGYPNYGGSINDISILRYLDELKKRNLKILFYPVFFMDTPGKPWRGRLTGRPESVKEFFNKSAGYNEFILHYASLVKGKVDAFLIGSELVGLTRIKDQQDHFPAVEELIKLAEKVKRIMGAQTVISYAADWSEYHHTDGGWFNLDPLWASSSIDVIGIDAYFPLTDGYNINYTEQDITEGWDKGEGYEYYYEDSERKIKKPLPPAYAWKNIRYWWENVHFNPNGKQTAWQAKSKKIWFTEYGFPSLDCATNQPNIFYDPTSSESNFPRYSKGKIDFAAQRVALTATEKKWQHSEMVERLFLWTWDARPYPFWPNFTKIWRDSPSWKSGHWVNGKLGLSSLGAILLDLCKRVGLTISDIDVSQLTQVVTGYVLTHKQNVCSAIEVLQQAYFFDIVESEGVIKFVLPLQQPILSMSEEELVVIKNQDIFTITRKQELELPQRMDVLYIDTETNYEQSIQTAKRSITLSTEIETLNLPIVFDKQTAKNIAEINLYNRWIARNNYQFSLSAKYMELEPGDIININVHNFKHMVKITNIYLGSNYALQIHGRSHDMQIYDFVASEFTKASLEENNHDHNISQMVTIFDVLDIPILPKALDINASIYVVASGAEQGWRGANILYSQDYGLNYNSLATITKPAIMGSVYNKLEIGPITHFDYINTVTVFLIHGELESVSETTLLNGANLAIVGNEIIQFTKAELIVPYKYKLSGLLRGRLSTEDAMNDHLEGERFILLDSRIKQVNVPYSMINNEIECRAITIGSNSEEYQNKDKHLTYQGVALKPFAPVHVKYHLHDEQIKLTWIRRARIYSNWSDNTDIPLFEDKELYDVEVVTGNNVVFESLTVASNELNYNLNKAYQYCLKNQISKITFCIYQISSIVGRGKGAEIEINILDLYNNID